MQSLQGFGKKMMWQTRVLNLLPAHKLLSGTLSKDIVGMSCPGSCVRKKYGDFRTPGQLIPTYYKRNWWDQLYDLNLQ